MSKVLLFSRSGFSDENANGITMKNLLSAWSCAEKAEFYCDVEPPDFSAADEYFRVTDMQMLKALIGKRTEHVFRADAARERAVPSAQKPAQTHAARIPQWLKKRKYHFGLKWLREILWQLSPWGHGELSRWIDAVAPEVIVYMVGESLFMDRLVLRTLGRTSAKLVLYNAEAYRIIDLKTRSGIERAYYRRAAQRYRALHAQASLVIFNCLPLLEGYAALYPPRTGQIIAYNSASYTCTPYRAHDSLKLSYFGNLGVGRVTPLIQVADALGEIEAGLCLDVYGNAKGEDKTRLEQHPHIRYHGFVSSQALRGISDRSDVLIHVESFDEAIVSKLHYAFSTKLAQYLCAGRPILCYAPEGSTSSEYLRRENGAVTAANPDELRRGLERLLREPDFRAGYAERARQLGMKNHDRETTAARVRREIEAL